MKTDGRRSAGRAGRKVLIWAAFFLRWFSSVFFLTGLAAAVVLLLSGGSRELAGAVLMILSFLIFSAPASVALAALTLLERFALKRAGKLWTVTSLISLTILCAEALYLFTGQFSNYFFSDLFYLAGAAVPNFPTVISVMEWERRRRDVRAAAREAGSV